MPGPFVVSSVLDRTNQSINKMNSLVFVALVASLAVVSAGVIPAASVIQGPSTRTTIAGPDGSVISAVAPGGSVVADGHVGVVAHTAPVVAHTAYSAPILAHSAIAPVLAHSEVIAHHGVVAHHGLYL